MTDTPEYVPQNGEVENLKLAIENKMNVLIVGPTGCGKTTLVESVTKSLNRKLITINGAEGVVYEQIVGYKDLKNVEGKAVTEWVDGALPFAMKTNAVLYVDEPNAMPDGMRYYLFSAMDYRRSISIPENNNEEVKAGEEFVVVGSMNEGVGYTGTTNLQYNFRDRFAMTIDLDYLPYKKEVDVVASKSGLDVATCKLIVKVGEQLRKAKDNKIIRVPISTRSLIAWATLINKKLDAITAADLTIVGKFPTTSVVERKSVYDIVTAHFTVAKTTSASTSIGERL